MENLLLSLQRSGSDAPVGGSYKSRSNRVTSQIGHDSAEDCFIYFALCANLVLFMISQYKPGLTRWVFINNDVVPQSKNFYLAQFSATFQCSGGN